jgi:hypothetical protein
MEGFSFVTPVTGLNRPNTGKEDDDIVRTNRWRWWWWWDNDNVDDNNNTTTTTTTNNNNNNNVTVMYYVGCEGGLDHLWQNALCPTKHNTGYYDWKWQVLCENENQCSLKPSLLPWNYIRGLCS